MEFEFCGRTFQIGEAGEDRKYVYYDIVDNKEIYVCASVEVRKKQTGVGCIIVKSVYEDEVPLILAIVQMAIYKRLFPKGEYYLKIGNESRDKLLKL